MAINSLASVAHAAGFAMVPEDDAAVVAKHNADAVSATLVFDGAARWQGSTQPMLTNEQTVRPGSIFDWVPNFSWRADGR